MFYDIFVNEKAANPDVVLMDGDKITLTPKGNSDPEPDPDTIAVSFLTYHDGTLGASSVEYAPKGSTLKEFFELATGGSISFESTLQYTAWFVNGEAADANTVLKDGDEVEAYVTIGDVPNPENPNPNPDPGTDPNIKPAPDPENPENPPITGSIQVNFTVDEGNQGSSMKYTVNTPCTLRQFYEEYADSGNFEDAIVKHDFFINGQLANGDALLSSDDEILMLRVPREGEIIIYFNYIVGEDYTEGFAVVPAGTYQLDKLLVEYVFEGLFQSYEEIAASFDIYINEQPASASDIVRAEDLVLMHSKGFDGEDDLKYFYIKIGIEHGGQFIEVEEFPVLYDEGVALGTLYNEMLANIFGLSQEFDEFIWTVNDQPATADTPLKDGDCVYAARKK
jgi:molybdopterin converting factor small subunit